MPKVKSKRKLNGKKVKKAVEELADWILSEEVGFRKLDKYRTTLRMSEAGFSRVLNISEISYKRWRSSGGVPTRNRDKMHSNVLGYLQGSGTLANRLVSLEYGGLEEVNSGGPAFEIVVPSATSTKPGRKTTPHLYLPLEGTPARYEKVARKANFLDSLQESHKPRVGDDYDACECEVCV